MLVKRIHKLEDGALYAVEWDFENADSLSVFLDTLSDVEYLRDFLTAREEDVLAAPYGLNSIQDVILHTIESSEDLVSELIEAVDTGLLNEFFHPLSKTVNRRDRRFKAYGPSSVPWLRLYAIYLDGAYIITGGGIKFYQTLQEDSTLEDQLNRLKALDQYLNDQHISITEVLLDDD